MRRPVRGRDVYYHCTTGADNVASCVCFYSDSQQACSATDQTKDCLSNRSYGAMAARWIPDLKVGGSNPSSFIFFLLRVLKQKKRKMPKLGIAPRLPRPQRGVLLLDYFGGRRALEDPGIDPGSQPCEGCMLPCTTIPHTDCVHRDSNPNLILGRDKYYPCTMDACYHCFSQNTNLK